MREANRPRQASRSALQGSLALAALLANAGLLAAPPPAEDAARMEARLLRPAVGTALDVQEPQPFRIHPELAVPGRGSLAASYECDLDALLEQTGPAFALHVQQLHWDCIGELFGRAPAAVRHALLSEANMLAAASAAASLGADYAGANAVELAKLFYYMRAGLFVQHSEPGALRWSAAVHEAAVEAIEAIVANSLFFEDESDGHGVLARMVFQFMDGPRLRGRYLPAVTAWLVRWNPRRAERHAQRTATTAAFVLVYNCRRCPETADDLALVAALRDFALGDWMVGTAAEVLAASASRELARLLSHADAPIHAAVRAGTEAVLNRYDALGGGASIWVAAALMVTVFDDCAAFGICADLVGLEDAVLSVSRECVPGVHVRGQVLTPAQLDAACLQLDAQAAIFHRRLATDPRQPLEGELPVRYEVVAFADYDNYQAYSPLFFGNATNNGGIYLEGDPSRPGNTSRHLGHVATWLPEQPIWNLEHEYVHHLDAHFNLLGQFYEHIGFDTVWWAEGLAEYLSRKDDNERAVALGRSGALPLGTVFATSYASSLDRVYRWSYLAVRFLFEKHPDVLARVLAHYRVGDFAGCRDYLDSAIGADYNAEWRRWLLAVQAVPYQDLGSVPPLEDRELAGPEEDATLDLGRLFSLGDGEVAVRATSSDPTIATVAVAGRTITLMAVATGEATITVTVGDAWGDAVRRFLVTVEGECPPWQCRSFLRGWRTALGTAH